MNETIPPQLTPTRLVRHRDKLVSIPVGSPKTVDNIFINDLQGFDSIISSIIKEKQEFGITFAMKLLGSYKFFYNLTDNQIKEFAYLTGIVAPFDSGKLTKIETDIYNIIFPKFTQRYQDLTDLTKENWVQWKTEILRNYIKNGVNDSNHELLKILRKNPTTFKATLESLITSDSFDASVKFNPFIGFVLNFQTKLDNLVIIDEHATLKVKESETKYLAIGVDYLTKETTNTNPRRLNKHIASLLTYVDSVLNKCILNYMNRNNMSYLDEFKETSIDTVDGGPGTVDGGKGKKTKSPKKSKKKSKKIKKKTLK